MDQTDIPNFLQLPTQVLLDEFGAGKHKPGSGSAAALLGLVACKMMQTVIIVTRRHPQLAGNMPQLDYVRSMLVEKDEPFFRTAVQRDSEQFDRYHRAIMGKRNAINEAERNRYTELARQELMPATDIPLEIARCAVETAERGLTVFDLGARHTRGDSGVAVSSALSSCSGALFIVYLNLRGFREGRWAVATRTEADRIALRYQNLQTEQFKRVSRIQAEGVENSQIEMQFDPEFRDENEPL